MNLTLSNKTLKPKGSLKIKIQTKEKSSISLLAIDKSITFLANGNDLNQSSIAQAFSSYESGLHVINDDLQNWADCTEEENKTLIELNETTTQKLIVIFQNNQDVLESSAVILSGNQPEDESNEISQANTEDDNIRDYFPETWIFETIDMGDSDVFNYKQKVPDSITSWIITAFSINEDHGIALAKPIELIVKQNFFMKLNVPSFVREGEVIKVEVIVFNYLEKNPHGTGTVLLQKDVSDNYLIVKRQKDGSACESFSTNDNSSSYDFSVASGKSTKVTFYVQAIKEGKMKLKFKATLKPREEKQYLGTETFNRMYVGHTDVVYREVVVEPVGHLSMIPTNLVINRTKDDDHNDSYIFQQDCYMSDLTISSDFISNSVKNNNAAEK